MFLFFIYGTLSALFALVAEIMSGAFLPKAGLSAIRSAAVSSLPVLISTIIVLASIEELVKYFVLRKTLKAMNDIRTVPASLLFGIGFAATELGLLFAMEQPSTQTALLPVLGILIIHVVTAVIYGYGVRHGSGRSEALPIILGISIHAAYNLVLALF